MTEIEIFSLENCPNCKRLSMMLDQAGIPYAYLNIETSNDALAEAAFRGILDSQFPVVYIDGQRLPAMTPVDYFKKIKIILDGGVL